MGNASSDCNRTAKATSNSVIAKVTATAADKDNSESNSSSVMADRVVLLERNNGNAANGVDSSRASQSSTATSAQIMVRVAKGRWRGSNNLRVHT